MKQIYKKLLAAALGVSMLLSMVGCGQSDTSEQTQTDSEQTQAANEKRSEGADNRHSKGTGQPYDTDHEQGE